MWIHSPVTKRRIPYQRFSWVKLIDLLLYVLIYLSRYLNQKTAKWPFRSFEQNWLDLGKIKILYPPFDPLPLWNFNIVEPETRIKNRLENHAIHSLIQSVPNSAYTVIAPLIYSMADETWWSHQSAWPNSL